MTQSALHLQSGQLRPDLAAIMPMVHRCKSDDHGHYRCPKSGILAELEPLRRHD